MNLLSRNFLRASVVLVLVLAYNSLNLQTAEWHDVLRLILQVMHSAAAREIFALIWLAFCTLDWVSGTSNMVSKEAGAPVFHSRTIVQAVKASD